MEESSHRRVVKKKKTDAAKQSDGQRRCARCSKELDAVLKKHRCVLEAIAVIGPQGVRRSIQVVPLP